MDLHLEEQHRGEQQVSSRLTFGQKIFNLSLLVKTTKTAAGVEAPTCYIWVEVLTKKVCKWVPASEEFPEDVLWVAERERFLEVVTIVEMTPWNRRNHLTGYFLCCDINLLYSISIANNPKSQSVQ